MDKGKRREANRCCQLQTAIQPGVMPTPPPPAACIPPTSAPPPLHLLALFSDPSFSHKTPVPPASRSLHTPIPHHKLMEQGPLPSSGPRVITEVLRRSVNATLSLVHICVAERTLS